jgi:hypothetical protein
MSARPAVDYSMAWECNFNIDGKTDTITFLTDDFETVYEEYLRMKAQHKTVVFVSHELKTKARMIVSAEMIGIPAETDGHGNRAPVMNAENPMTPQRVRNAVNRGEMVTEPAWMNSHNSDIARNLLREPPQDKV